MLVFSSTSLHADLFTGLVGKRADRLEEKRFEKSLWNKPLRADLTSRKFPIQEWGKHYSSLGSKRAAIGVGETKEKKRFQAEVLERKEFSHEMSRWNERMSDLYKRAGIQLTDEARLSANQNLYNLMLQDRRNYADLAKELSLRDINRFQFRRNMSDSEVPTTKAGSGSGLEQ